MNPIIRRKERWEAHQPLHPHIHKGPARTTWVRSLVKTVVYRVISASSTIAIAGLMFGDWTVAGAFGLADLLANTALYFIHERVWAHIDLRAERKRNGE